ncbi:L,D-transpeptidase [Albibacterium profundi]|uniref:L,D-transpeptidase n=1 Tax=Albibacterium profundi TaxID=3134906 RepID=A0ABV5C9K0_9SPHI
MQNTTRYIFLLLTIFVYGSCRDSTTKTESDTQSEPVETQAEPFLPPRLEISISKRQLFVIEGSDTTRRYAISVGTDEYPTPQGEYEIHQIDWNPDWTPPDSDWSEDESYKKPGEEGNPMGRARIIYDMPYTIHGTKALESLGKAESHGSVRMANEEVIELGRFLMERSGTGRSEEWFERVLNDSTTMESVTLEQPIQLTNVE